MVLSTHAQAFILACAALIHRLYHSAPSTRAELVKELIEKIEQLDAKNPETSYIILTLDTALDNPSLLAHILLLGAPKWVRPIEVRRLSPR